MGNYSRRISKSYSEEFKQAVVNSMVKEGMSPSEASLHYKVPERNLYFWRSKYDKTPAMKREIVSMTVRSESEKIRKLEGLISELSIRCRVLKEQVKIYEEMAEGEGKKKLSMKQLEELERLKQELSEMID